MTVVSIIRSASALTAMQLRVTRPTGPQSGEAEPRFSWERQPLEELPLTAVPQRDALLAAWERLGHAAPDATCLADVQLVLAETVAEPVRRPVRLHLSSPRPPRRATAAHPRAYRGTIQQPPKPAQPVVQDLRPALSDPNALGALLNALGHPDAAAIERQRWPFGFASEWAPLLRRDPLAIPAALGVFHQVGADEELRAAIACLLASGQDTSAWLGVLPRLPAHLRLSLVAALAELATSPGLATPEILQAFEDLAILFPKRFGSRAREFLTEVARGVPIPYLVDGFRLLVEYGRDDGYLRPPTGIATYSPASIRRFLDHGLADIPAWRVASLWELSGRWDEWGPWLETGAWQSLTSRQLGALTGVVSALHSRNGDLGPERRFIPSAAQLDQLARLFSTLTDEQAEAVGEGLDRGLWASKTRELAARLWSIQPGILARLAQDPSIAKSSYGWSVAELLSVADGTLLDRVRAAPLRSFGALAAACVRDNDEGLVAWGLMHLVEILPAFTVDMFLQHPARLMRTAKLLGCSRGAFQRAILQELRTEPLLQERRRAPSEWVALLEETPAAKTSNPVPAALRQYLQGRRTLSASQVDRHERVLHERLGLTRLQFIEERTWAAYNRSIGLELETEGARHAILLAHHATGNQRGLRRFLRVTAAGSVEQHATAAVWFRQHPGVNVSLWQKGIERVCDVAGRTLTLAVEQEPFEILKLGTYVGSCLGIGGICSESAISALLDANKRVVFARDSSGAVVARQLLAISEDERLIPFHVYSAAAGSASLEAEFRSYDAAFAERLGLPLGPKDETYDVKNVRAPLWWDDGAWTTA